MAQFVTNFAEPTDPEYAPPVVKGETPGQRRARIHQLRLEEGARKAAEELEKYDPNSDPLISGDRYKRLFVARLNYETTESRIKREFEAYGPIKRSGKQYFVLQLPLILCGPKFYLNPCCVGLFSASSSRIFSLHFGYFSATSRVQLDSFLIKEQVSANLETHQALLVKSLGLSGKVGTLQTKICHKMEPRIPIPQIQHTHSNGLSLNIDMSARAFYEPRLVTEFVGEFLAKDLMRPLSDQDRIKVIVFLGNCYSLLSIEEVIVYFQICRIVSGQTYAIKLNEKQVTNLLRATCQRPIDREKSIVTTMQSNKYNENDLVN